MGAIYLEECCFGLPLDAALKWWAGLKIIMDVTLNIILIIVLLAFEDTLQHLNREEYYEGGFHRMIAMFVVMIVIVFIDAIFMTLVLIAADSKHYILLGVGYCYSVYLICGDVTCILVFMSYIFITDDSYIPAAHIIFGMLLFAESVLDISINVTLKSFRKQVKREQQSEVINLKTLKQSDNSDVLPSPTSV